MSPRRGLGCRGGGAGGRLKPPGVSEIPPRETEEKAWYRTLKVPELRGETSSEKWIEKEECKKWKIGKNLVSWKLEGKRIGW